MVSNFSQIQEQEFYNSTFWLDNNLNHFNEMQISHVKKTDERWRSKRNRDRRARSCQQYWYSVYPSAHEKIQWKKCISQTIYYNKSTTDGYQEDGKKCLIHIRWFWASCFSQSGLDWFPWRMLSQKAVSVLTTADLTVIWGEFGSPNRALFEGASLSSGSPLSVGNTGKDFSCRKCLWAMNLLELENTGRVKKWKFPSKKRRETWIALIPVIPECLMARISEYQIRDKVHFLCK